MYGEINRDLAQKIAKFVENDVRTVNNISIRTDVLPHREIKLENSK